VTAGNLFLSLFSHFQRRSQSAATGQNKNPTAVWQWGSINLVNESEPYRRAAQQQRVQQQVQSQITLHAHNVTTACGRVK
jgi:hypothetical protein